MTGVSPSRSFTGGRSGSYRAARCGSLAAAACLVGGVLCLAPRTVHGQPLAVPERAGDGKMKDGHRRMLELLEEIRVESAGENPWLGEASAGAAREALAAAGDAPPARRFRLLVEVAEEDLRLGNESEALERFGEAYGLLAEVEGLAGRERAATLFRIAVAWLRYGESRNCAATHGAEACILPIRGGAVHREREGSEQAARYLREYLSAVPENSVQEVQGKWLLNLVHMTLGDHPGGVEPEYRLPLETFGSGADFPRFRNVAPALGIDTFNLSGGAVVDDFDGDSDLDIFTTTFDPAGEPRFFVGDGKGGFEDRTAAAGLGGPLRRTERGSRRRRQRWRPGPVRAPRGLVRAPWPASELVVAG